MIKKTTVLNFERKNAKELWLLYKGKKVAVVAAKEVDRACASSDYVITANLDNGRKYYFFRKNWYENPNNLSKEDFIAVALDREHRDVLRLEAVRVSAGQGDNSREPIPPEVQRAVWARDKGRCVKCESQTKLHFDHIIPVSKGGSNSESNIQILCFKCNLKKGALIGG